MRRTRWVEVVDDPAGGLDSDVGGQQQGLQFLEQFVVDLFPAQQQIGQAVGKVRAGAGETLFQALEQAGGGGLFALVRCRVAGRGGGVFPFLFAETEH